MKIKTIAAKEQDSVLYPSIDLKRESQMEWLVSPGSYAQTIEMVCCVFTLLAVFVSYVLTMRF